MLTLVDPAIGSIWLAKDGRRLKVVNVLKTNRLAHQWKVDLDVLPPHIFRQRRRTILEIHSFIDGFLTLEATDQ